MRDPQEREQRRTQRYVKRAADWENRNERHRRDRGTGTGCAVVAITMLVAAARYRGLV